MLTTAQLTILKADIAADAALSAQPNTPDGNSAIAAAYNQVAVPDSWAWRTYVEKHEYTQGASPDGTLLAWTGAGYITRSQGERDAFREIFNASGSCNPSLPNVRTAFVDIFSGGTNPAPANRAHLSAVSRRKVTRGEKLFAVLAVGGPAQTGLRGATGNPDTLTFEGALSYQDVEAARNLP